MISFHNKTYKITALAPIHIGNIHSWYSGVNFRSNDINTKIYTLDSLSLNENDELIGTELDNIDEKIRTTDSKPSIEYSGKIFGQEISQFAKNGWGNPYVPGNSLHGFYNTALALNNNMNIARLKSSTTLPDFSKTLKQQVIFEDTEFPRSSVKINDIKILNLTSDQTYGWKKFGKDNQSIQNPMRATSFYLETIDPGEYSLTKIKIKNKIADINPFDNLENICNELAKNIVENEMKFYDKCHMDEGYQFYWSLKEQLRKIQRGFFVCVGWGVGWNVSVGSLHDEKSINRLRQTYDLGKINRPCPSCKRPMKIDRFNKTKFFCFPCKKSYPIHEITTQMFPIFPKTRKFLLKDNKPVSPLGWLRFEETPMLEKTRNPETKDIEIRLRQKSSKMIRTPFLKPEEYPTDKSQTSHFKKKIKIPNRGNFPTEFNMFFNKLAQLEFIISINGNEIDQDMEIMQNIASEIPSETVFHFSNEGKGIILNIKTGAKTQEQYNFTINRLWEIIDSMDLGSNKE